MGKLGWAALACVLMCACDEEASRSALVTPEDDAGEVPPDPDAAHQQPQDDADTPPDADAATEGDAGPDGATVEPDAAQQPSDAGREPRVGLTFNQLRAEVTDAVCLSCHDSRNGGAMPYLEQDHVEQWRSEGAPCRNDAGVTSEVFRLPYVSPVPDWSAMLVAFSRAEIQACAQHKPFSPWPTEAQLDALEDWVRHGGFL